MGRISELAKDIGLAFKLCRHTKSFKVDFIFYAICGLIFLIGLTSDALSRGDGNKLYLGLFLGVIAPIGVTTTYHSALYSDFCSTCQISRKLQIGVPHLLSNVGVFLAFSLAVLIEWIFGKGERGDVIAYLALFMGAYMFFAVSARKNYWVMVVLFILFVMPIISGGVSYISGGRLYYVLSQLVREYLKYFKDKQLEATLYGYGILLLCSILSWYALRRLWKFEGSKFYQKMREKVI